MTFDYKDYVEMVKRRSEDDRRDQAIERLRLMAQGAIQAEVMTSDPHWNTFCQVIQGEVDRLREAQASYQRTALANSEDSGAREYARVEALRVDAAATALEGVMGYPKILLEQGEKARELLGGTDTSH